jgi:hypothetical protein
MMMFWVEEFIRINAMIVVTTRRQESYIRVWDVLAGVFSRNFGEILGPISLAKGVVR